MNREMIIKLAEEVGFTFYDPDTSPNVSRLERFAAAVESESYQLGVKETLAVCNKQIERLKIGHDRYETARLMNPRMWSVAWEINVNTGKPFDEIIDNMRPFFMGDK